MTDLDALLVSVGVSKDAAEQIRASIEAMVDEKIKGLRDRLGCIVFDPPAKPLKR